MTYICSFPIWASVEAGAEDSVADVVQAHVRDLTGEDVLVDADLVTGTGWVCHPGDLLTPFQIEQLPAAELPVPAAAGAHTR